MRLLTDSVHFVDGTAPCSWNTATVKREDGPQWDKPPAALELPSPDAVYSAAGATGLNRRATGLDRRTTGLDCRTTVTITTGKP